MRTRAFKHTVALLDGNEEFPIAIERAQTERKKALFEEHVPILVACSGKWGYLLLDACCISPNLATMVRLRHDDAVGITPRLFHNLNGFDRAKFYAGMADQFLAAFYNYLYFLKLFWSKAVLKNRGSSKTPSYFIVRR